MAQNKTTRTDADVAAFLATIDDEGKRTDATWVRDMMAEVTGEPAAMWGTGIVGFGDRHLVYDSGRELDWFTVGFAPRARNLTLYIMDGFDGYDELLARLGRHTTGKSCLHVTRLDLVDRTVLRELVTQSVANVRD